MSPLLEDRLPKLAEIHLSSGGHESFAAGVCAMEMVAYLAGEPHSDMPECTCPVLTKFMLAWNDGLPSDAERDRLLKPFLPRLIGTRSTPDVEERRAFLAMDWLMRTFAPMWLDRAEGLGPHATALRALDAVQDLATLKAAMPSLHSAADAAWAATRDTARTATRDATRDAARTATRDATKAAAWAATRDAAWAATSDAARAAAWSAAGAAAWDAARAAAWSAAGAAAWAATSDAAATRDAAGAAAWAARAAAWDATGSALAPTVLALQQSAGDLLDRMIAVTPAPG